VAARGIDALAALRTAAGVLAWLSPHRARLLFGLSAASGADR
jgi:hypothetical protein